MPRNRLNGDGENFTENIGFFLKKREKGCIVNDSDVVYPEYDVRKVPGSGSSGTPFFSGHLNSFRFGGFSRPGKVQLVRFSVVAFSGSHARIFLHWHVCPPAENPSDQMIGGTLMRVGLVWKRVQNLFRNGRRTRVRSRCARHPPAEDIIFRQALIYYRNEIMLFLFQEKAYIF